MSVKRTADKRRAVMKSLVILTLSVWVAIAANASAASLDGSWAATTPPCSAGDSTCWGSSDLFTLDVWSSGSRLCATHAATSHLGKRVDEDEDYTPSIEGTIKNGTATVAFKSHFGGSGHATITLQGHDLLWHVTDHVGDFWIPSDAILAKQAPNPRIPKVCESFLPGQK